jgi:ABC-type glycerol-3-phosphate transport system permease component
MAAALPSSERPADRPFAWLQRNRAVVIRHAVINLFMLIILLPLFWVFLLSIKSLPDSMRGNLWPRVFDFGSNEPQVSPAREPR